MAASGGMYLASAATEIVAERTTIVGSIGVVSGKLSFGQSLAELGVRVETVESAEGTGARALYGSALAPWDDATRQRVRDSVDAIYELFVARVAEGRRKTPETIGLAAEGRLFGGSKGVEVGLVDRLGGLGDAIDRALELAKLPAETPIDVVAAPGGLLALLGSDGEARESAGAELERRAARASQAALLAGLEPIRAELDAFLGSTAPMLQGERVLCALPFVLAVR
jgi:protease-4